MGCRNTLWYDRMFDRNGGKTKQDNNNKQPPES